jgi:DNA polymerase I-like protein with 3'-5' exonuclease and polymerase domains
MSDLLNADPDYDLHSRFAANFSGDTYESFRARLKYGTPEEKKSAKLARQRAKAANFGFPGGLGATAFCAYARTTYGVELTVSEAKTLKALWSREWSEVAEYQALVGSMLNPLTSRGTFALVQTGFVRGDCRYTQACNTQFQGLAAAGAKEALWRVCQWGESCDVFPVAFLHDEILAEVPIHCAHDSAEWLAKTMIDAMRTVVPDVPITASPSLMTRWYKEAETVRDKTGTLIPWQPGGKK